MYRYTNTYMRVNKYMYIHIMEQSAERQTHQRGGGETQGISNALQNQDVWRCRCRACRKTYTGHMLTLTHACMQENVHAPHTHVYACMHAVPCNAFMHACIHTNNHFFIQTCNTFIIQDIIKHETDGTHGESCRGGKKKGRAANEAL